MQIGVETRMKTQWYYLFNYLNKFCILIVFMQPNRASKTPAIQKGNEAGITIRKILGVFILDIILVFNALFSVCSVTSC